MLAAALAGFAAALAAAFTGLAAFLATGLAAAAGLEAAGALLDFPDEADFEADLAAAFTEA